MSQSAAVTRKVKPGFNEKKLRLLENYRIVCLIEHESETAGLTRHIAVGDAQGDL